MTRRKIIWVSRAIYSVIAAAAVFFLFIGLISPSSSKNPLPRGDTSWSQDWHTSEGQTIAMPCAMDAEGRPLTIYKELPMPLCSNATLVISSSYLPVAASIENQPLEVSGSFLDGALGFSYANAYSVISLPENAGGKTLTLTLYPEGCKFRMELYEANLGSSAEIRANYLEDGEWINLLGLFLVVASILVMIGNLLLRQRNLKEQSGVLNAVALFILLSAMWFLLDSGANTTRFGGNQAYLFGNLFVYLMFGLPFELLMLKLCPTGRKWFAGVALLSAGLSAVVILSALLGQFHFAQILSASHVLYMAMIVVDVVCVSIELLVKKNRRIIPLFFGLIILVLTGWATLFHFYFSCSQGNATYFRTGVFVFSLGLAIWALSLSTSSMIKALAVRELQYAATHDDLTGLYNKSQFYRNAENLLRSNRTQAHAICCVDIENFRLLNEIIGRDRGDQILRFIAQRLHARIEGNGVYGRMESDKFLICVPYSESHVRQLCQGLQEDVTEFSKEASITLCFGWAIVTDCTLPMETLADRAASARRLIKGQYLNHIAFYDEGMRRLEVFEQSLINDVDAALVKGEFLMYLQPKYDLRTERIVGFEALARWKRSNGELLLPGKFIPLFERNGMILRVDEFIWRTAFQTLRRWISLYGEEDVTPISVNVSQADLYYPNLPTLLKTLAQENGVATRLVQLEITETACSDSSYQLTQLLEDFRNKGFSVHMDDFGSGYSSLNMLRDMAVDAIKIDMRFLDNVEHNQKSRGILKAVVDMANAMDIYMIAEGVENAQQAQILKEMGCQSAQGYYYSRPIPIKEAERLLFNAPPSNFEEAE